MNANKVKDFSMSLKFGPARIDALAAWIGIERKKDETTEALFERYNEARESLMGSKVDENLLDKLKLPCKEA